MRTEPVAGSPRAGGAVFPAHTARLDELTGCESISYLHPSKRWEYPWALERARLTLDSRVLDAGCGASIFPVYLSELGYQVTAVDRQLPEGLTACHGVAIDYVRSDITVLPFEDRSFDAVFCISVIEHLGHEGMRTALQELRRVAKPGARLLITTDYYQDANAEIWFEGDNSALSSGLGLLRRSALAPLSLECSGIEPGGRA